MRDLSTVNHSLILHAACNIATGKNSFLAAILKSKYFPTTSFWLAGNNSTKSAFWSSIMQVKDILINNCTIQVQKGNSSIWSSPWCSIWKQIHGHINLPLTVWNLPQDISDLWIPGTVHWNIELINQIFDTNAASAINNVIVVPSDNNDAVKWKPSPKGNCSAKEAFKLLNSEMQVQLPTNGASVANNAMDILSRV